VAVIRQADRDDVDGIVRLHSEASEFQGRLDLRLAPSPGDGERFGSVARSMIGAPGGVVLVAEAAGGGSLVGFAVAAEVENGPFVVSRFGYARCICSDESHREPGVAIALYEALRDRLASEGLRAAQTDVPLRDSAAQRFWKARGFRSFLDHFWRPTGTEVYGRHNSPWNVREARASDSEVVLSLWREMMDIHGALDERLRVVASWRSQVAEMLRRWMREPGSRVIVADGPAGVIGFAVGSIEDLVLGLKPSRHGHIAHLCVTAQCRRHGVGRQLFGWLRDWFQRRGVGSIHLYASHLNPVSQRFWRGLGFQDYMKRLWCTLA